MNEMRRLIMIAEGRLPDVEYVQDKTSVTAKLRSYNSAAYTRLANKMERMEALEAEIKQLKAEVKAETKENIADLFDAADAVHTRVIETIQFVITMSKDPKPTETVKYKEVIDALTEHLTPELIAVLNQLRAQFTSVVQKSPSLKITARADESISSKLKGWVDRVFNWANSYDKKLDVLKRYVGQ